MMRVQVDQRLLRRTAHCFGISLAMLCSCYDDTRRQHRDQRKPGRRHARQPTKKYNVS